MQFFSHCLPKALTQTLLCFGDDLSFKPDTNTLEFTSILKDFWEKTRTQHLKS